MRHAHETAEEVTRPELARLIAEVARSANGDLDGRLAQLRAVGHCRHPIRLRGEVFTRDPSGALRTSYSTKGEPDGVILVRCRNRRARVCPSCAWEYQGDIWQLLYAGVAGGRKGVPAHIATHPMAFVTLTAPGFGAVHTRRADGGSCRAGRGTRIYAHGMPTSCDAHHAEDDPCLGAPLCADCYDYDGAVGFNWHAPELWRRFVISLRRQLARRLGTSEADFCRTYRVSFAKVAEFQRRGVVHLHAILRLDGAGEPFSSVPLGLDAGDLCAAARKAASRVWVDHDAGGPRRHRIRFGAQYSIHPVGTFDDGTPTEVVAAYLAKYATKSVDDLGVTTESTERPETASSPIDAHLRRMVMRAHALHDDLPGIRRWAHMLGFRGHFATKSRAFSTTMGALRTARTEYRSGPARWHASRALGVWTFDGAGHRTRAEHAVAVAESEHTTLTRCRSSRWTHGKSPTEQDALAAQWDSKEMTRPRGRPGRPDAAPKCETEASGGRSGRSRPKRE